MNEGFIEASESVATKYFGRNVMVSHTIEENTTHYTIRAAETINFESLRTCVKFLVKDLKTGKLQVNVWALRMSLDRSSLTSRDFIFQVRNHVFATCHVQCDMPTNFDMALDPRVILNVCASTFVSPWTAAEGDVIKDQVTHQWETVQRKYRSDPEFYLSVPTGDVTITTGNSNGSGGPYQQPSGRMALDFARIE